MLSSLEQVEGLIIEADRIVFSSMLGDQSRHVIANLTADLVDANCFVGACTLVRVCKPSVRLGLLNFCGSERVERLRKSGDEVFKPLNRALEATAHKALRDGKCDGNFHELFGVLRWWPEARSSVMTMFPPLTMEMVGKLDGDDFVDAVRLTVDRARTRDTLRCLTQLRLLLLFADELKALNLPWMVAAMTAIIRSALDEQRPGADEVELMEFAAKLKDMARLPELTPDLVSRIPANGRAEVLRVAVVEAENSQTPDACAKRLQGLAACIDKLGESEANWLRSQLMTAVSRLLVRWDEPVYQAHKGSLPAIPAKPDPILRGRFLSSIVGKTDITVEKPAETLIQLADDFRRAVATDDLRTAAVLIRDCPHPEFGNPARESLFEAVIEKLAAAGYQAALRPVSFMVLAEKSTDVEREEQRSVVLQMAVVLAAIGDPECSQFASTILSIVFPMPQDPEWAIRRMVGEPKRNIVGVIPTLMIYALPLLCGAELSPELDVILKMEAGQELVARTAVDGLRNGKWNNAQVTLLFNALAHRVDLGPALPAIQTTVRHEMGGTGRIEQVLDGAPLTDLKKILAWHVDLSDTQIRHVGSSWAPGWRLIWVMLRAEPARVMNPMLSFLKDPMFLMGAKAIDAAAADGLRGGADELLHRLKFPCAQQALDAMLQLQAIQVNGTPLLSDGDLHNVLRAMLSDKQLGQDTFAWMREVDPARRVKLHAAAGHALISLADDLSPCRFYPDRPANHVAGDMVRMFQLRVLDYLDTGMNIGKAVEATMGEKAWHQISLKFPPPPTRVRTGIEPGVG